VASEGECGAPKNGYTLDSAIMSLGSSCALLRSFKNACGYLCVIKKIIAQSNDDVTIFCSHLEDH
jgi:hypothetical protein